MQIVKGMSNIGIQLAQKKKSHSTNIKNNKYTIAKPQTIPGEIHSRYVQVTLCNVNRCVHVSPSKVQIVGIQQVLPSPA